MKKHLGFIAFFAFLMLVFFREIIFMRSAFLGGDYAAQFYPWSMIYSEAIKNFHFPFWTRYFHCGFPLMAEGQTGGFYPPNFLMFFLLPFRAAYNYIVVLHFILAGIFTYIYTRKIGACQWGGALAALLFCFGSAYAGCFYNTVTVKTLVWFPLVLFLFERYFEKKKAGNVIAAGFILGIQFLAGFAQMALYSALFYLVYFVSGLAVYRQLKLRDIAAICGGFAVSAAVFFPQFMLSGPLVSLSGRAEASLEFALWGSFPPLNFMSLVFPYWIFSGTRLYIGIFSLLFLFMAFAAMRHRRGIRPLFIIFLTSLLLALGKYNPFYVLFLGITRLYGFRNPSKFLFFGMFAASVLAGWGFTEFFTAKKAGSGRRVLRAFSLFIGAMTGLFFLAKGILLVFGGRLLRLGKWYAVNYIYGKDFHRYDLEHYLAKVKSFYANFIHTSSLSNPFILTSLVLCVLALLVSWYFMRGGRIRPVYKGVFITVIFLDIFVFSFYGTGFRGNIKSFDSLKPQCASVLNSILGDKDIYRILPYNLASGELPDWAIPNLNAIYGLDSIAAYTPLAPRSYKKETGGLEVVDDSLGLLEPPGNALARYGELIRILNVKYIISPEVLHAGFLKKVAQEAGIYLYEVKDPLPRGFVVQRMQGPVTAIGKTEIVEYRSGYAVFSIKTPEKAFFVFSEFNYPGWKAAIDGKDVRIEKFRNVLMAVRVPKGAHRIRFRYMPFSGAALRADFPEKRR